MTYYEDLIGPGISFYLVSRHSTSFTSLTLITLDVQDNVNLIDEDPALLLIFES